jgi:hypothetical protein
MLEEENGRIRGGRKGLMRKERIGYVRDIHGFI